MDWPEEERPLFANSRDYEDDGIAVMFLTSVDIDFIEPRWKARLCGDCKLPYLKGIRMAEVNMVVAPENGLPGATVVLYLHDTEEGWLLFDWQIT
jgi:hypothetical protein